MNFAAPVRCGACLTLAALVCACEHHPSITYPAVRVAGPAEAGMDCRALDDEILKSDAVRWAMREDGARLIPSAEVAVRRATDTVSTIAEIFTGMPVHTFLRDEGSGALDRADRRLLSLLELKQQHDCEPRPTGWPPRTDLELRAELVALVTEESDPAARARLAALYARRTELLDRLRP